jgi:hypothetical protein
VAIRYSTATRASGPLAVRQGREWEVLASGPDSCHSPPTLPLPTSGGRWGIRCDATYWRRVIDCVECICYNVCMSGSHRSRVSFDCSLWCDGDVRGRSGALLEDRTPERHILPAVYLRPFKLRQHSGSMGKAPDAVQRKLTRGGEANTIVKISKRRRKEISNPVGI